MNSWLSVQPCTNNLQKFYSWFFSKFFARHGTLLNHVDCWFLFIFEFVLSFVVSPTCLTLRRVDQGVPGTHSRRRRAQGMSKKFTFQRGGRGAPGIPQPPGRETSSQRLQTAWRAHACRWPLARVPQGCVRIAAMLLALLLPFHLAHIVVASMHVTFYSVCGAVPFRRRMDAELRCLFLEPFASGEPFEERVTGLPKGAALTARLRLLLHSEWYSQAAFQQGCRAGENGMSVDDLKAFIRRRACPLYLSDDHLRDIVQHVQSEMGCGASGTVSFAMFTRCMLRVLDSVGLSPLGIWGSESRARERHREQITTDIGGFSLRQICVFPV
jgi:hypothetical protein